MLKFSLVQAELLMFLQEMLKELRRFLLNVVLNGFTDLLKNLKE